MVNTEFTIWQNTNILVRCTWKNLEKSWKVIDSHQTAYVCMYVESVSFQIFEVKKILFVRLNKINNKILKKIALSVQRKYKQIPPPITWAEYAIIHLHHWLLNISQPSKERGKNGTCAHESFLFESSHAFISEGRCLIIKKNLSYFNNDRKTSY